MNRSVLPLAILGAEFVIVSMLFQLPASVIQWTEAARYTFLYWPYLYPLFGWLENDSWINLLFLLATLGMAYSFLRERSGPWGWYLLAAANALPFAAQCICLKWPGLFIAGTSFSAVVVMGSFVVLALVAGHPKGPTALFCLEVGVVLAVYSLAPQHIPLILGAVALTWPLRRRLVIPGTFNLEPAPMEGT